jgi:hypothetical protein
MAVLGSKLVVFGGGDNEGTFFSDWLSFDVDQLTALVS